MQANLVAGMKWFLGTYTSRFNRRRDSVEPYLPTQGGASKASIFEGIAPHHQEMLTSFRLAPLDMGLNGVSPHHDASRNQGGYWAMFMSISIDHFGQEN